MAIKSINDLPTTGLQFFSDVEYEQYRQIKPFNIVLWSYSDDVDFLTDELFSSINADKVIRYKNQMEQYKNTLKGILCNCIESVMTTRSQVLVPLNHNEYTSIADRYNPLGITSRVFINLIDWLAKNDFINLYKATKGANSELRSVMIVTAKLRELIHGFEIKYVQVVNHKGLEPIELRRAKKLIDYDDDTSTSKDRLILKNYQELLNSHQTKIKIDGRFRNERVIIKRVYTEEMNKHGRLYGGSWQNCKSHLRDTITINDRETVEIDIVNCSLRMAVQLSKINIENDLYSIKDYPRGLVKDAINMMLNISNVKSDIQGIDRTAKALKSKYRDEDLTYLKQIVQDCFSHYKSISNDWFFQGRGLDLQYLDSCICLKIIEEFTSINEIVLTVHDSFIVRKELEDKLKESIIRNYEEIIGDRPIIR
jgi:hypothetical protein